MPREQRREFWRRDKVAACPKLVRDGMIIAECGVVERHRHVTIKADAAAYGVDGLPDLVRQASAACAACGSGSGSVKVSGGKD